MSWNSVDGGYDDVQSTAPSSPSIGDTWLDTSTDPPIGKVYADLGGGGEWTTNQLDTTVSSRSSHSWDPQGRIDQPISEAGATQSEVEDAVDSSTTGGRINTTLSSRSSHSAYDVYSQVDAGTTIEDGTYGQISGGGGVSGSFSGSINTDDYFSINGSGWAAIDTTVDAYVDITDTGSGGYYEYYFAIRVDGSEFQEHVFADGNMTSGGSTDRSGSESYGPTMLEIPFNSSLSVSLVLDHGDSDWEGSWSGDANVETVEYVLL